MVSDKRKEYMRIYMAAKRAREKKIETLRNIDQKILGLSLQDVNKKLTVNNVNKIEGFTNKDFTFGNSISIRFLSFFAEYLSIPGYYNMTKKQLKKAISNQILKI